MSLQHTDFTEKSFELVGSPEAARRMIAAAGRGGSAVSRATSVGRMVSAVADALTYVLPAPVDPVRHPADLTLPVRALAATECQLAAIARVMGFDFWGEAASLILAHVAAAPDEFPIPHLKAAAPDGLLKAKGAIRRGRALAPSTARGIQVPLTRATLDFLDRVAEREKLSRKAAASLILHRHAARVLARVTAPAPRPAA